MRQEQKSNHKGDNKNTYPATKIIPAKSPKGKLKRYAAINKIAETKTGITEIITAFTKFPFKIVFAVDFTALADIIDFTPKNSYVNIIV